MRLLPRASLVVTHAGLGTVMAALAHGVPLLCMPLGRDQFFNASRVEAIGAGRAIGADAGVEAIAAAVRALLHDEAAQAAARRFATVIAGYGGAAAAVEQLEALSNIALPMSDACLRSA
jgi:UDP:flavonoid glycosyltransferase YjiC (YdhE family)